MLPILCSPAPTGKTLCQVYCRFPWESQDEITIYMRLTVYSRLGAFNALTESTLLMRDAGEDFSNDTKS